MTFSLYTVRANRSRILTFNRSGSGGNKDLFDIGTFTTTSFPEINRRSAPAKSSGSPRVRNNCRRVKPYRTLFIRRRSILNDAFVAPVKMTPAKAIPGYTDLLTTYVTVRFAVTARRRTNNFPGIRQAGTDVDFPYRFGGLYRNTQPPVRSSRHDVRRRSVTREGHTH